LLAGSGSRLGQNAQTQRGKTATPTGYVPTIGRRSAGATQSTFGRFPLNEPDDVYDLGSGLLREAY
jgi:hypothetical protein